MKTKTANILLTLGLLVVTLMYWSEKTFSAEIILSLRYQFIKLLLVMVGAILFSIGFLALWVNSQKNSNKG